MFAFCADVGIYILISNWLTHLVNNWRMQFCIGYVVLPWCLRWYRICLQCRRPGFDPWVGKIPWRRKWQPTPVFLPGKFHRQRRLVGYSPRGCKEPDTTEQLTHSKLVVSSSFTSYLLIYLWLRWVFLAMRGLSLVAVSGGYPPVVIHGFYREVSVDVVHQLALLLQGV